MSTHHTRTDLHSEQGALPGEHPGRAKNPIIKVRDLAWLEFEKPDLKGAEAFAHAFGFATSYKDENELHLRGTLAGGPAVVVRRGAKSRFTGPAFLAADDADLLRLADHVGAGVTTLPDHLGGLTVDTLDPSGARVRVVSGFHQLPALLGQQPLVHNAGDDVRRTNATQRPPREPA